MMIKNKITILLILVFITFTVFMNGEVLNYREKELAFNLENISRDSSEFVSTGLVSRYLLIKKRSEKGVEDLDDYLYETKLQGILRDRLDIKNLNDDRAPSIFLNPFELLTRLYLKSIRSVLGKEMPEDIYNAYNNPFIELAYFYERHRRYDRAIEIMRKVAESEKKISGHTEQIILLHAGFCNAMLMNYNIAHNLYIRLIKKYPGSKEAETAQILLNFLASTRDSINAIMKKSIKDVDKAEKLYLISAYIEAKKLYDVFLQNKKSDSPVFFKARFFRGRSAEETGDHETALNDFNYIIANRPESVWAKKSNQRIMILGSLYENDERLKKAAIDNTKKIGDESSINQLGDTINKFNDEDRNFEKAESQYNELIKKLKDSDVPKIDVDKTGIDSLSKINIKTDDKSNTGGEMQKIPPLKKKNDNFTKTAETRSGTKKLKINIIGENAIIVTKNSDLIKGTVISDTSEAITVETSLGDIRIMKNTIISLTIEK